MRASVHSPIPADVATECRKCADIIDRFVKPEKNQGPDQFIPPHILADAKGIAIITIVKAGFIFSGRGGAGLVVARLPDGSWSPPSANPGMGVGGQIGAEITDFVIILNTDEAVAAFSLGGNVTLGGNLSVAAGPYGRNAEAAGTIGKLSAIYSYSKTKGLFAGVSIEGSVIIERKETNAAFYGERVTAKEILAGKVPKPAAAAVLYRALERRTAASDAIPRKSYSASTSDSLDVVDRGTTGRRSTSPLPPPTSAKPIGFGGSLKPAATNGPSSSISNSTSKSPAMAMSPPKTAPRPPVGTRAVALYDFNGEVDSDLSFKAGDLILVTKRTESAEGWWSGECNGKKGDFPGNYVQLK